MNNVVNGCPQESSWWMSWANSGAVVPRVHTTGTMFLPSTARTWVPWVTSYPPLGRRRPLATGTPTCWATSLILGQRPGDADEGGVEPVEPVPQHRSGVPGRVGGDEHDLHVGAVGRVELEHRRGQRRHRGRALVGAVRVAEEDEGEALVRAVGQGEGLTAGVGQPGRGHVVGHVQHRARERARQLLGAAREGDERHEHPHETSSHRVPHGRGPRSAPSAPRGRRRGRRGRAGSARRPSRRSPRRRTTPPRRPARRC